MALAAIATLTLSAVAAVNIPQYRCVDYFDGIGGNNPNLGVSGKAFDGYIVKGISMRPAAIGKSLELAAVGTAVVEAGGVIAIGDPVSAMVDGTVIRTSPINLGFTTQTTGAIVTEPNLPLGSPIPTAPNRPAVALMGGGVPAEYLVGYALTAALKAGDLIEIKLA